MNSIRVIMSVTVGWVFLLSGCVDDHCFSDPDCEYPAVCNVKTGLCVFECNQDNDCPGTYMVCENHRCEITASDVITDTTTPLGCPDDMVIVENAFCIDRYEASRPDATAKLEGVDSSKAISIAGVVPWKVADNATAQAACEAAGKRLCAPVEWETACRGPDETTYSYGNDYEPETCNGLDTYPYPTFHLMPTGSFPNCTNEYGVFDINGNLWEHTLDGSDKTVRGGAYNCNHSYELHKCGYVPGWVPSARGFRCCREPIELGNDSY